MATTPFLNNAPVVKTASNPPEDPFKKLYEFDVTPYVQKMTIAGRDIEYIEWATAWRLVKTLYPGAAYRVQEHEARPYIETPYGLFVHIEVTIEGRVETDWYPVESDKNGKITTFDISVAHQRGLVKCLGRHGFGLKLWEKEERRKLNLTHPAATTSEPAKLVSSKKAPQGGKPISEPQVKRLWAISKASGKSTSEIEGIIKSWGYTEARMIGWKDYEAIVKEIEFKHPDQYGAPPADNEPPPFDPSMEEIPF